MTETALQKPSLTPKFCSAVAVAILVACAGSGCTATGTMSGRLSGAGEETSPVTFSFTSQRFGEGGRISTTLPNGEKFSGTYLQITSTTGGFAEESEAYENPEAWDAGFGDIWNPGGDVPVSHQHYSAKVIATLSGNRGDTMHCGFRLNNPKQGMARGGTGKCLVSSGGTIKVQF